MKKIFAVIVVFMFIFSNVPVNAQIAETEDIVGFSDEIVEIIVSLTTRSAFILRRTYEIENPGAELPPESFFIEQARAAHTIFRQQLEEAVTPAELARIETFGETYRFSNTLHLRVHENMLGAIARLPEVAGITFYTVPSPPIDQDLNQLVNILNYRHSAGLEIDENIRITSVDELVARFPNWQTGIGIYDEAFFEDNFLIFFSYFTPYTMPFEFSIADVYDKGNLINIEIHREILNIGSPIFVGTNWTLVLEVDNALAFRGFSIDMEWQPSAIVPPPDIINLVNISYYNRTGITSIPLPPYYIKITSVAELIELLESTDRYPHSDNNFQNIISTYDDAFFENNVLLFVDWNYRNGSLLSFEITSVHDNGNLIEIEAVEKNITPSGEAVTPAPRDWLILFELDLSVVERGFSLTILRDNGIDRINITTMPIYQLEITADIDFGRVERNSGTLERIITIENVGNQPMRVTIAQIPFAGFPTPHPFMAQNSSLPQTITRNLNPGEYFDVEIVLDRNFEAGIYALPFSVLSYSNSGWHDEEILTTRVDLFNPFTITPAILDFGTIQQGDTIPDTRTITIRNIRNSDLILNALPNVSGFTLGNLAIQTLSAGQSVTIDVNIDENLLVGNHDTTFTISTVEGADIEMELRFTIIEPVPPLLYSIDVSGGTLRPTFDPNIFEYTFTANRSWWVEPYYNENLIVEWSGRGVRITYADGHEGNPDFRMIDIIGSPVIFTVRNPVTGEEQVYTVTIRGTGGIVHDTTPILPSGNNVIFNTNGGSAIDSQRVNHNGRATRPVNPTREGFRFEGWYADSALTTAFDFNTQITANITLFARWSENQAWEENPFTDVRENDWFYNYVEYVFTNDLMQGVSPTEFAPNSPTTRAMAVTILWRLAGEPTANVQNGFYDVAAGTWYTTAVQWAAENGVVLGIGENLFAPHVEITREQMATILWRYSNSPNADGILSLADTETISYWAVNAVTWAVENDVLRLRANEIIAPQALATRAEIAFAITRISN